jgi:hypothetical protein
MHVCEDDQLNARLRAGQESRAKTMWSWDERMDVEVSELESLVKSGRGR